MHTAAPLSTSRTRCGLPQRVREREKSAGIGVRP